ncbi:MAG: hypothetical protein ABI683_16905 [Ginsengibacter sp.]
MNESIVYAISAKLHPKLIAALAAIIALMPLAIAVIGGFIISLPLLFIVLPSMRRLLITIIERK